MHLLHQKNPEGVAGSDFVAFAMPEFEATIDVTACAPTALLSLTPPVVDPDNAGAPEATEPLLPVLTSPVTAPPATMEVAKPGLVIQEVSWLASVATPCEDGNDNPTSPELANDGVAMTLFPPP